MPKYQVFQQQQPIYVGKDEAGEDVYRPNLVPVGVGPIVAVDAKAAIQEARGWFLFRTAKRKTLARVPIVQEVA